MSKEYLAVIDEINKRIEDIMSILYLQLVFDAGKDQLYEPDFKCTSDAMPSFLIDKQIDAVRDLDKYLNTCVTPLIKKAKQ